MIPLYLRAISWRAGDRDNLKLQTSKEIINIPQSEVQYLQCYCRQLLLNGAMVLAYQRFLRQIYPKGFALQRLHLHRPRHDFTMVVPLGDSRTAL